VKSAQLTQPLCVDLKKIERLEVNALLQIVGARGLEGTIYQGLASLHTNNFLHSSSQGQGEVAETAKQIHDPLSRFQLQQGQSFGHQGTIYIVVDLREVCGTER